MPRNKRKPACRWRRDCTTRVGSVATVRLRCGEVLPEPRTSTRTSSTMRKSCLAYSAASAPASLFKRRTPPGPPPPPLPAFCAPACRKFHGHRTRPNHHPHFGTIPCLGCHTCSSTLSSLTTTITLSGYPRSTCQVQGTSRLHQTSKVCGYWLKMWQPLDHICMVWERGRAPTVEGDGRFCDLVALVRCTRWTIQNSGRGGFWRYFATNAPTQLLVQLEILCTC